MNLQFKWCGQCCDGHFRGLLVPTDFPDTTARDGEEMDSADGCVFVARCDACERFADDVEAAWFLVDELGLGPNALRIVYDLEQDTDWSDEEFADHETAVLARLPLSKLPPLYWRPALDCSIDFIIRATNPGARRPTHGRRHAVPSHRCHARP